MEAQSSGVTSLRSYSHEDAGLAFDARSSGARLLSLNHRLTENFSKTPSLTLCLGLDVPPSRPPQEPWSYLSLGCCDVVL